MSTGLKMSSLHVNVYFPDQNTMKNEDPMKLNFEGFEMQKMRYLIRRKFGADLI